MDWQQFDRGVFLVNVLGVVYNSQTREIIIGRRENDPFLQQLSWSFPGGRPDYHDELEEYLKQQVQIKTNLDIEVNKVLFAKTYPEKREFLSIYYLCSYIQGEAIAGEKFGEVKWVKPSSVQNYFSTSTSLHPKLLEILKKLD